MFGVSRRKSARVKVVWTGNVPDHVIDAAWSHDGRFLAVAASTGPVTVFDAKAGSGDRALSGHGGGTLAIGWSPKHEVLATAGKDSRVRLWQPDGKQITELEASGKWVEHLTWHPDGSKVAASSGRVVHLWDATGKHLADLTDHPSTVSDLAWKPKGDTVAALVYGGVMLWT